MAKTNTLRKHRKSIDFMLLAMAAASTGKTVVAAQNIQKALKCKDFQIAMGELDTLNEDAFEEEQQEQAEDELPLEDEGDTLDAELSKLLASSDDEEEVEEDEDSSDDEDDEEEDEAPAAESASVRRARNLKAIGQSAVKRSGGSTRR